MFKTSLRSFTLFGLGFVMLGLLFVATGGEVQARDRRPNKPAPRAPYYNPLNFDYQAEMRYVNSLPAAYYSPRYYWPPYPYPPYPYPYYPHCGNVR